MINVGKILTNCSREAGCNYLSLRYQSGYSKLKSSIFWGCLTFFGERWNHFAKGKARFCFGLIWVCIGHHLEIFGWCDVIILVLIRLKVCPFVSGAILSLLFNLTTTSSLKLIILFYFHQAAHSVCCPAMKLCDLDTGKSALDTVPDELLKPLVRRDLQIKPRIFTTSSGLIITFEN